MNESLDPKENKEQLRKKILLADDDPSVRRGVKSLLQALGCEVVDVENGKELLAQLYTGEKFDMLLTDNNMPEMNGVDAVEEFRKDPRFTNLPVVMHTATLTPELEARMKNLGGRCIQKPYDMDTLEKALEDALGSREGIV